MTSSVHALKILVSVELGSPAANCAHFGICSMEGLSPEQWAVFHPRHVRHVRALLSVTAAGSLRFVFPLKGMRPDTRAQFFPPEGFRVDSATELPHYITALLNLPEGAFTQPGIYNLSLLANKLIVKLAIATSRQVLTAAA